MPSSRATWLTGRPDSRVSRTASDLKASVNWRRVGGSMLTSNFIMLPLMEVSTKLGRVNLTVSPGDHIGASSSQSTFLAVVLDTL
jgi:hypothetical protein